jgi:cytochrome c553
MKKIIALSFVAATVLVFSGCGNKSNNNEETKTAVSESVNKVTQAAKETANKAAEATKEAAAKATEAVKEGANKAAEATKEAASKAAEAAKETANKAVETTKEAATKAAEATKEAASKAAAAASGSNEKGKAVYAKCVSCHGPDGKTKALGKSEIIAGQNAADLEKKMQEYKAGTRNVAGMGSLMKGQVAGLSDEDIKAVAEYIANLK